MTERFRLQPVAPQDAAQITRLAALWNAACGEELAVTPRFVAYNLRPSVGIRQTAMLAYQGDTPTGFVVASVLSDPSPAMPAHQGWIDALAVAPEVRRQGIGSRLLTWAEGWLLGQDCRAVRVGGSLRPFVTGLPAELASEGFFARHGYGGHEPEHAAKEVWDVAADLSLYTPPPAVVAVDAQARPARPADRTALAAFLRREFPDRWHYEFEQYLADGGRIADYMLLWTARGVDGCCILTFPDSLHPIERFYPYRLPRPWGQLGSIGISADRRGRGYGAALLDAGLRRLHANGINGCIIDWTDLLAFYAKFGFTPYRRYWQLYKRL
jgi:GNAT superfamily N-acetyltransferase